MRHTGGNTMRSLRLLAWITQFGISVAAPPVLCALLGDYLQRRYALGSWVLWVLILVGILSGVAGLRQSLRSLRRISAEDDEKKPPRGYNGHE